MTRPQFPKRHQWEDVLIDANVQGRLSNGGLHLCLRLAKAINWSPKDKKRNGVPGLYWKNEDALRSVGSSLRTYERYGPELREGGFITTHNGNLIPTLPPPSWRKETARVAEQDRQVGGACSGEIFTEDPCSEDLRPNFSTPSLLAPDPSTWTTPDEGVEVCMDHGGGTTRKDECQHCFNAASRRRAEAKHSDAQKRQWFEKNQHESEDSRALA